MAVRTERTGAELRNVAILRPGRYRDMAGRSVEFSAAQLQKIAGSYDPAWHLATLNLDHSGSGPALGHVQALRFEHGYLLADIAGLPDWFAAELSEGRWPARSAEIWRELDGRGPYLRGLAFLGARAPAVRGLPALPALQASLATQREGAILILTEEDMETGNAPQQAELARLAAENRRLATELSGLRRREAEERVDGLLAELRLDARLSPGMEASGLRELLIALGDSSEALCLADGTEAAPYDCLEQLLRSLPALELGNELAGDADGDFAELSGYEHEIAASLGLTDMEYSQIRDARTA